MAIALNHLYQITILYDLYGELLTEKQKQAVELHFFQDMTLNEIAGQFGVSPQGVHDLLKRTEKILLGYEEKLALAAKFEDNKKKYEDFCAYIQCIDRLDARTRDEITRRAKNLCDTD